MKNKNLSFLCTSYKGELTARIPWADYLFKLSSFNQVSYYFTNVSSSLTLFPSSSSLAQCSSQLRRVSLIHFFFSNFCAQHVVVGLRSVYLYYFYILLLPRRDTVLFVTGLGSLIPPSGRGLHVKTLSFLLAKSLLLFLIRIRQIRVITQNEEDQAIFSKWLNISSDLVPIISGSGIRKFHPRTDEVHVPPRLVWIGRDIPHKNLLLAIYLASSLPGHLHLHVLGSVSPSTKFILSNVPNIHLEGWIDDPSLFLRSQDIVLVTSTYREGLSRSYLDAIAAGSWIVSCRTPGFSSISNIYPRSRFVSNPYLPFQYVGFILEILDKQAFSHERVDSQSTDKFEHAFSTQSIVSTFVQCLS